MSSALRKISITIALLCINISIILGDEKNDYCAFIAGQGYSGHTVDLSDSSKLKLSLPKIAYLNLESPYGIPYTKTSNFKDQIEFYDPESDVYFKKKVIVNLQGASSTSFVKRNGVGERL